MPRVISVDPKSPDPVAIAEAVRLLRDGGLVAFPTETVYGLGASAFDARAVDAVFAAKGRPPTHPLIAHVLDAGEARALAASWPHLASLLAVAFWPGPLTMVVDRGERVPPAVSGGADSIALRAPSHPVARALLAALGAPIAAPSANRYQGLSPTIAAHVVKELGDAVDLVLDGGPCDAGLESTVVDVRGGGMRVLRPGAVGLARLRDIGAVEKGGESAREAAPRASPGMDARHYAPRARLLLAATWEDARRMATGLASSGQRVGLVVHALEPIAATDRVVVRCLPCDPVEYARLLYRTLHELDDAGVDAIVAQAVPAGEAWWAVADRLRRGASS
ncbi:MAG: L-threonylcarbamoyladenylate synthase [Polyangiaceae bacterium]